MLQSIFDYEHAEHPNPPFAVTEAEVSTLYSEHFKIQLLQESDSKKLVDIYLNLQRKSTTNHSHIT